MVSIAAERNNYVSAENLTEPAGFERKYITIDERKWQYLEAGDPQGTPFVFLHGWFVSDARGVSPYSRAIAERGDYRVVVPEIPGFRGTDKLEKPSMRNMAVELNKFTQSVTDKNFVLAGVSMGAGLSIELAANFPDRISALVLHNSITNWTEMNPILFALSRVYPQAMIGISGWRNKVEAINEDMPTLRTMLMSIGSNLGAQIRKLRCPVVVVDGSDDKVALGHQNSHLSRNLKSQKYIYHMLKGDHEMITKSPYEVASTVHSSLVSLLI